MKYKLFVTTTYSVNGVSGSGGGVSTQILEFDTREERIAAIDAFRNLSDLNDQSGVAYSLIKLN